MAGWIGVPLFSFRKAFPLLSVVGGLLAVCAPVSAQQDQAQMHLRMAAEVTTAPITAPEAGATAPVEAAPLPDAPLPASPQPAQQESIVYQPMTKPDQYPPYRSIFTKRESKFRQVINPGEPVLQLNAGQKLWFSVRESITPSNFVLDAGEAGVNFWQQNDPKYGSDRAGFGERYGATLLRGTSGNIISDGVLANVFHEDPRYYRVPERTFWRRVGYVARSPFFGRKDDGQSTFDYSGFLGRAIASALTLTYYPQKSANGAVAGRTFGYSLAGEAGGNLFFEFWPDVLAKVWKKHDQ